MSNQNEDITDIRAFVPPDAPRYLQEIAEHQHAALKKYQQVREADPNPERPVKLRVRFDIYNPKAGKGPRSSGEYGAFQSLPGFYLHFNIWSADALFEAVRMVFEALKPRRKPKDAGAGR